jgi:hypothetical protein
MLSRLEIQPCANASHGSKKSFAVMWLSMYASDLLSSRLRLIELRVGSQLIGREGHAGAESIS